MVDSIHDAVLEGDINRVKSLLKADGVIEQRDENGDTPFLVCCSFTSDLKIMQLLIEKGADINACNTKGESSLFIVLKNKNLQMIDLLLENNAEVNNVSEDGTSPLFWAVYKGLITEAKALLDRGADPKVAPLNAKSGSTLAWAVNAGDLELVDRLLNQGADINTRGLLHHAVKHKHMMQYLIEKGADVNKKGDFGSTALHIAAYKCKPECVKILLDHGADPSLKDDEDAQTAYEWALKSDGDAEEVLKLLESR